MKQGGRKMWCNNDSQIAHVKGKLKMIIHITSRIFLICLCVGLIFLSAVDNCSSDLGRKLKEEDYKAYHRKTTEFITGDISIIQPTYIGIITFSDNIKKQDTEMLFFLDEEVIFKSKALAELQEGDKVKIIYENITEPDPEDAEHDKFVQRVTREIQFLSSKSKTLKSSNN